MARRSTWHRAHIVRQIEQRPRSAEGSALDEGEQGESLDDAARSADTGCMEPFFSSCSDEHYLTGSLLVRVSTPGDRRPVAGIKLQVEAGPAADCGPG
jgi:hypothetical protein